MYRLKINIRKITSAIFILFTIIILNAVSITCVGIISNKFVGAQEDKTPYFSFWTEVLGLQKFSVQPKVNNFSQQKNYTCGASIRQMTVKLSTLSKVVHLKMNAQKSDGSTTLVYTQKSEPYMLDLYRKARKTVRLVAQAIWVNIKLIFLVAILLWGIVTALIRMKRHMSSTELKEVRINAAIQRQPDEFKGLVEKGKAHSVGNSVYTLLQNYLKHIFGVIITDVTEYEEQILRQCGASDELIAKIRDFFEDSNRSRFSQKGNAEQDVQKYLLQARDIVDEIKSI